MKLVRIGRIRTAASLRGRRCDQKLSDVVAASHLALMEFLFLQGSEASAVQLEWCRITQTLHARNTLHSRVLNEPLLEAAALEISKEVQRFLSRESK